MAKKFSSHYKTILIVAALALIMVLDVFLAPTKASAARASNSPNRYKNPTVVQVDIPEPPAPDPQAGAKKYAEEQQEAIYQEGTKAENQTVDGAKTGANGLYLANKVKGVAVTPGTQNEGGAALFVETLDTDAKKSSAAMASIKAAAYDGIYTDINGTNHDIPAEVGPVVDVYFKKTENGKIVDGTANDVDNIKIGIPDNFRAPGYRYGYIIVFPGGKTVKGSSWSDADEGIPTSVNINMVRHTWNDPVDYSQATIAIYRSKTDITDFVNSLGNN